MAFKFVPQTYETYMIINGLGQAAEVLDPLIGKGRGETGFLRLHLYMNTPDTNN
jgi:hypothetical protein